MIVVLVTFSFVAGDVVCDLVGNGLLSLDAIVDSRLQLSEHQPSEHLHYLVEILSEEGRRLYLSLKTTKPPAKVLTIFSCCTFGLFQMLWVLPKRIQSQPDGPTQGCHNVMPARIAGGRLLLDHTNKTTSSEAASQCRI